MINPIQIAQNAIDTSSDLRSFVRARGQLRGTAYPILVVGGSRGPRLAGEGFHHVTPGGRPVRFPNAYRRAYGKPVYVASTVRIEVSLSWLRRNRPRLVAAMIGGA